MDVTRYLPSVFPRDGLFLPAYHPIFLLVPSSSLSLRRTFFLMFSFSTRCVLGFVLLLDLNLASPVSSREGAVVQTRRSFDLPIRRTVLSERLLKRGPYSGSTGLGDSSDLCVFAFY